MHTGRHHRDWARRRSAGVIEPCVACSGTSNSITGRASMCQQFCTKVTEPVPARKPETECETQARPSVLPFVRTPWPTYSNGRTFPAGRALNPVGRRAKSGRCHAVDAHVHSSKSLCEKGSDPLEFQGVRPL